MNKSAVDGFLLSFDDSRFPEDFLQKYEQMECLAHNQMGETLLVRDRQSDVYLVAKCYTDQSLLSRKNESDLLRALRHDGLPAFVGEYQNEAMLCVVRDYAEGVPLNEYLKSNTLSEPQIISIGTQLCDILSYLHGQTPPIIHRDIKPQNIVVDDHGKIKLIDFGISRVYDETASRDTVFFGTMEFAPPEQYGFAQTDCRADIFSLGVVLCWMLTGETKPGEVSIKNRWLGAVIKKCTAFSPEYRYRDAQTLKRALLHKNVSKWRRTAGLIAGLLVLTIGIGFWQGWITKPSFLASNEAYAPAKVIPTAGSVQFAEPLIEQAVRTELGKSAGDTLTSADLESVTELYIFADKSTADVTEFERLQQGWNQNNGTIESLSDLAFLPNLRELCLSAQNISDISPVAGLASLERIELRHNPVSDISSLAGLEKLKSIGLNGTMVADISPVINLKGLELLDLNDADHYDPAVLAGRTKFDFLDISNDTDSYKYLKGKTIRTLKIMKTDFDSLTFLAGVEGLEELYLNETKLTDLTGIEAHESLVYLNVSGTRVRDLSPLLSLPGLQQVVVDTSMKKAAEAIAPKALFEIIYE
ncbi:MULTISPECIES: protein kinase [Dehalobacter]|jgi:serine/threonine protein kinase|uniref:non-specific serine/threonine protein kinase n=1 Tax=Dehalobacter restrictus (strain DSM 9455 / PER-K23) TaxID=871738 RepID=A0ABM5PA46_DEHRP|nr:MULTISPECIES: protein kinase [Dehalobacter]AHF11436.1 hypothetical protein DEHRE_10735 [Dehalobacter restrictus DSM 9455]MDJ0304866.1 protein kinase [Dehalobacter sp.]